MVAHASPEERFTSAPVASVADHLRRLLAEGRSECRDPVGGNMNFSGQNSPVRNH